MIIFLHFHKAAGSTIIKSAVDSGFILPNGHQNGNLTAKDGSFIFFEDMPRAKLNHIINHEKSKGTNFFAFEWDFPNFRHLSSIMGLEFITCMREPFDRAKSNYIYDRVNGFSKQDSFAKYLTASSRTNRDNYYVRMLSGCITSGSPVTDKEYGYALQVLEQFSSVLILGKSNLGLELSRYGIDCFDRVENSLDQNRSRTKNNDSYHIKPDEERRFYAENKYDVQLFEAMQEWPERNLLKFKKFYAVGSSVSKEDAIHIAKGNLATVVPLQKKMREALAERDQAVAERDQAVAESDQAVAERDQAVAERDQAAAERDQAVAERDKAAAERDKAAAERDKAAVERNHARRYPWKYFGYAFEYAKHKHFS